MENSFPSRQKSRSNSFNRCATLVRVNIKVNELLLCGHSSSLGSCSRFWGQSYRFDVIVEPVGEIRFTTAIAKISFKRRLSRTKATFCFRRRSVEKVVESKTAGGHYLHRCCLWQQLIVTTLLQFPRLSLGSQAYQLLPVPLSMFLAKPEIEQNLISGQ
ncbi:hypothetical protein BaRGS_00003597 [Batillaria attramentaria]|uniref:Uncharacterized protein n=1 Tax=Batillaria attramentaria TaxID=370345 RepID=A0ABD0M061_9CAEN